MNVSNERRLAARATALGESASFDLYIEYWGMEDNLDYQIGMLEKKKLYQQAGKKLVSLHASEKPHLANVLREKLNRYTRLPDAPQGG